MLGSVVQASDALHVPLLVKYHQESHAVAGALVGLGTEAVFHNRLGFWPRLAIGVGTALAVGTFKEYVIDKHPRNKEIGPWGVGAAAAVTLSYTFRW